MTIPTITSVTPSKVHTGGGTLVEVRGTGFQLPTPPAAVSGTVPKPAPTVRVFFSGTEAQRVRVASDTLLLVQAPARAAGPAELEVRNVGKLGETLGEEWVRLAGAITFARPELQAETHFESVIRALMLLLKQQVHEEVVYTQHVDWTDTPEALVRKVVAANPPSIIIAGPQVRPTSSERRALALARFGAVREGGFAVEERDQDPLDLVFTLGCVVNHPRHLYGLVSGLETFVKRTPRLSVGSTSYEFAFEPQGHLNADSYANNSNILSATGSVAVHAVLLGELPGLPGDMEKDVHPPVEHVELGFYQLKP